MAMRKKLSSKKSRKMFSKGAVRTPSINTAPAPMRGGFRI